jgi:hypothetical protein
VEHRLFGNEKPDIFVEVVRPQLNSLLRIGGHPLGPNRRLAGLPVKKVAPPLAVIESCHCHAFDAMQPIRFVAAGTS